MKILYTAEATSRGGRDGQVCSSDGKLAMNMCCPRELGGTGQATGQATNPEQLFAAGYASCFQASLMKAANSQHVDASQSTITSKVGIGQIREGAYGFDVELHISLPSVDKATGEKLIEQAHQICPFSNATRGNVPVRLFLEEQPLAVS
ncbi:MAG TPA: organic hydroperoxide resistance protein [Ktedonosporobacter sp.]|nr:organic hydroperoxide resistance protein [Ktedonosporobacter sp.]